MQREKALGMIERLIAAYKFKRLPSDLSKKVRKWFFDDISKEIDVNNLDTYMIYNKDNIPLVSKIDRIIISDYGPLLEFDSIHSNLDMIYENPNESYRSTNDYIDKVNYLWYTSNGNDKICLQLKEVEYANLLVGKFYVLLYDIMLKRREH